MGGEGQGGLRDTNLPSSAGRGELSGGRASGLSFHKMGTLIVRVQVEAVDGGAGGFRAQQTNPSQLEFVGPQSEHLGCVEEKLKHGAAKHQLHDGNKRTLSEKFPNHKAILASGTGVLCIRDVKIYGVSPLLILEICLNCFNLFYDF